MMKKRILIIYQTMMVGGSTTSLLGFLNSIDKSRYHVELQTYRNDGDLFELIPSDVTVLPPAAKPMGRVKKVWKGLVSGALFKAFADYFIREKRFGFTSQMMAQFQVRHLCRKPTGKEYDYAIAFLEGWADYYLAEKVNAKKKIGWYHTPLYNYAKNIDFEKRWLSKVDTVALVSEACKEEFVKTYPEFASKAVYIPNIMDSKVIKTRSEQPYDGMGEDIALFREGKGLKIVTVCRLDIYIKGLDRLVRIAKRLKDSGHSFLWCIVGDSAEREALQSMVDAAEVADCVKLLGQRKNPYPVIKEADIICSTSRVEGKPMTVTEAMILGTVPVVTEYISAREQIEHGVDGLIADNHENALFEKLMFCMENPEELSRLKDALRSGEYGNAKQFSRIESDLLNELPAT